MPRGYVSFILHAHLPFIRHPEEEGYLEERWLYEGITECYLPILAVLERLDRDRVPGRLTISTSPPLLEMLSDDLLQRRYRRHLEKTIELANKEVRRTAGDERVNRLARMYRDILESARRDYSEKYGGDLVGAFAGYQNGGRLEVITCGATHGFLPLLGIDRRAMKAQVGVAVAAYRRYFGHDPAGFWLPECGYAPGVDEVLADHGLKYFVLEGHGLLHAAPRPRYGLFAPVRCPAGPLAFGRDQESSKQVWSASEGYPGDYNYREYYRDIGFDLDFEYVRPYIHHRGIRVNTGLKYYRVTGPTNWKDLYDPDIARETAARHAGNFMWNRERQIEYLAAGMDRPPIVVAPYDAELFGHWWFEGPRWLEQLFRKAAYDQDVFALIGPSDYLAMYPEAEQVQPVMSSWGYQGYNDYWLDGSNHWIYRHLHMAQGRMEALSARFSGREGLAGRALRQAARELLLAQSSDWPFIMKTGTMVDYANKRFIAHIGRFTRLYEDLLSDRVDPKWLEIVERADNIFPEIDPEIFAFEPSGLRLSGIAGCGLLDPRFAGAPAGTK